VVAVDGAATVRRANCVKHTPAARRVRLNIGLCGSLHGQGWSPPMPPCCTSGQCSGCHGCLPCRQGPEHLRTPSSAVDEEDSWKEDSEETCSAGSDGSDEEKPQPSSSVRVEVTTSPAPPPSPPPAPVTPLTLRALWGGAAGANLFPVGSAQALAYEVRSSEPFPPYATSSTAGCRTHTLVRHVRSGAWCVRGLTAPGASNTSGGAVPGMLYQGFGFGCPTHASGWVRTGWTVRFCIV
jgi:hypothetical protein